MIHNRRKAIIFLQKALRHISKALEKVADEEILLDVDQYGSSRDILAIYKLSRT